MIRASSFAIYDTLINADIDKLDTARGWGAGLKAVVASLQTPDNDNMTKGKYDNDSNMYLYPYFVRRLLLTDNYAEVKREHVIELEKGYLKEYDLDVFARGWNLAICVVENPGSRWVWMNSTSWISEKRSDYTGLAIAYKGTPWRYIYLSANDQSALGENLNVYRESLVSTSPNTLAKGLSFHYGNGSTSGLCVWVYTPFTTVHVQQQNDVRVVRAASKSFIQKWFAGKSVTHVVLDSDVWLVDRPFKQLPANTWRADNETLAPKATVWANRKEVLDTAARETTSGVTHHIVYITHPSLLDAAAAFTAKLAWGLPTETERWDTLKQNFAKLLLPDVVSLLKQ